MGSSSCPEAVGCVARPPLLNFPSDFLLPQPDLLDLAPSSPINTQVLTFAGLAICLQLEAVVAVASGSIECGDTVVLAAQLRTVASELCGGQMTHTQAPDLAATPRLQPSLTSRQPFRAYSGRDGRGLGSIC